MPKIVEDSKPTKAINKLAEFEQQSTNAPIGYIKIELSTQGRLGAPKVFHAKNFNTQDIAELSLAEEESLPDKVTAMLDNLIYEEDVSVSDWHEEEVIEFIVLLFKTFFSDVLKDMPFQVTDEEIDKYVAEGVINLEAFQDYKAGRWKLKTDINLNAISIQKMNPDFNGSIKVNNVKNGLQVSFGFPRFGDLIVIKKFLLEYYTAEDKRWASIRETVKYRMDMEKKFESGDNIDLKRIPQVPKTELDKFKEYEIEKAMFSISAIRALHLKSYMGKDLSEASIAEKIQIIQSDPRFDITLTNRVDDYFTKNLNVGIKKELAMYNPITKEVEARPYSFQLLDILQAISIFRSDDYDIQFES